MVADSGDRAAFLGTCLATDHELRDALRVAVVESRPEALQELPGSYAVVFDTGQSVRLLTDRAGLHPIFHVRVDSGVMFASDALMLAALRHGNPADAIATNAVAAALFVPGLLDSSDCVFRGVTRTGPDSAVTIHLNGANRTDKLPRRPQLANAEEASAALRTALVTSVQRRARIAGDMSADLSGGLDSSTLAVLAAQAGGSPLAVTYADPHASNDEDVHFARTVAIAEPRLHHAITAGDSSTLPFTAMNHTPLTDEPSLDAVIIARTRHRLEPAVAHRSGCHLTGDGGDVVLTASGLTYLGDLARAGRRRDMRREASGWARLRNLPARDVHRAAIDLADTSWTDTLDGLADQLRDPDLATPVRSRLADRLAWATLSAAASWGTMPARTELANRLHASSLPADDRPDSADAVAARDVAWHAAATRGFTKIARALGVAIHAPFFDNQVLGACLSVPATARTTVERTKPLLVDAVGDLMPAGLLNRRTKGDYTACEYHGLRTNAEQLRALLTSPLLADLGVLDPSGPREALRLGLAGMPAPLGALGAVIATETWLHALRKVNTTNWWRPNTTRQEHR